MLVSLMKTAIAKSKNDWWIPWADASRVGHAGGQGDETRATARRKQRKHAVMVAKNPFIDIALYATNSMLDGERELSFVV